MHPALHQKKKLEALEATAASLADIAEKLDRTEALVKQVLGHVAKSGAPAAGTSTPTATTSGSAAKP